MAEPDRELVAIDDLLAELDRRWDATLFVATKSRTDDTDWRYCHHGGNRITALGLASYASAWIIACLRENAYEGDEGAQENEDG